MSNSREKAEKLRAEIVAMVGNVEAENELRAKIVKRVDELVAMVAKRVTPWDLSEECLRLHRRGMIGSQIALALNLKDESYPNNLIRIREKCHPTILAAFAADDPRAKTDLLASLAKFSHDVQLRQWNAIPMPKR